MIRRLPRSTRTGTHGPYTTLVLSVSNAVIQIVNRITDFSFGDWKKMLAIHLDGAFLTTRECLKDMQARGDGGAISYMGSVHSHLAARPKAPYVPAKHVLLGLCRPVAPDGGEHSIRAHVVRPGFGRPPLDDHHPPDPAGEVGHKEGGGVAEDGRGGYGGED